MQIVVRRDLLAVRLGNIQQFPVYDRNVARGVGSRPAHGSSSPRNVCGECEWLDLFLVRTQHARKVLHETRERVETKEYLDDLFNMHKSVFQVRV